MKKKSISYAKWGYIFLIPFFVAYLIFAVVPLVQTFYFSVLDYKVDTGMAPDIFNPDANVINKGFCGLDNFKFALSSEGEFLRCLGNTAIIWLIGFIPQIVVSLILAVWFTDIRLKLKAQGFFKTVIYLPNVIMASAISLLFYTLCIRNGALDTLLNKGSDLAITEKVWGARGVVGFINFIMWYGNTTIMLMAAIMGIDTSLYESAQIDGASPTQTFWKITIPLIKPILAYVLITSMIGGLQMFDVPQFIGGNQAGPKGSLKTVVMIIQNGKDSAIGSVGAISVMIFIISAILGFLTLKVMSDNSGKPKKKKPARK
ncbi:MAG: sugar ABC transporter permease [Ruminococcus sp.]|nr:sugar ABC transporter permease [Ruminococcus sp.]